MAGIGNVLIIDDDEGVRTTLARVLQNAGCMTSTASDGPESFKLISRCEFDLVLLDIFLPKLNGVQVLREVRGRCPKLPVIMLTGHGSLQSAVESLRLGAIDYLQKPVDPEILVARVRIVLEEQRLERRKEEIRLQITGLQSELQKLEAASVNPELSRTPVSITQERFVKNGRLILDVQAKRATFGDQVLNIPPATFEYLVVLAKYSPEVVEYKVLVTEAQDYQVSASDARELAKWHVHVLRNALEVDPQNPSHLINVRGVGYRLISD